MPLPESASQLLRSKLEQLQTLSPDNIESFIDSLAKEKPVNWNLLLNSEIEEGGENEVNS